MAEDSRGRGGGRACRAAPAAQPGPTAFAVATMPGVLPEPLADDEVIDIDRSSLTRSYEVIDIDRSSLMARL
jgi:hypothetical protein